ncbi:phage tail tape measure protein [Streptomyces mutabilis]|uniref:phage tail tape measure protein n=1 Tax=Streptomyces mutabilis TaxID=67332 RepID=UPI0022BA51F1|nr:phage tail tape measure protein [Streptomyces mutabilis]MCZ9353223.1 phage tail tape measure protein [Streptomyces mutabilis]
MALTVGELLVSIEADDTPMRSGLAAAAGDARRSGNQIGENVADGIADAGGQGAEQAGGTMATRLGDSLKAGLAGVGLAAGALLGASFAEALNQGKIVGKLGAQLGATPAEAEKYGKLAGRLYANAVTEDFQSAADTISAIMRSGIAPPGATEKQLEQIATKASDLATTWDEELGGVTRAVSKLMATGLAKSADEAFDLIAKGYETSANSGGDFLDTLNEYSVQFKRVGLDGQTAIGLIDQAIDKGARDSDQVADAIGQFGELAIAGGSAVDEAFKSIGLNADEIRKKLSQGGKAGQEALQMTTDALRNQTDEQTKLNAATALFGDPGTVMGDALFALDPASAAASSGMDKVKGSAGALGDALRDNAGTRVEQFKRGIQQNVVDFLGGTVIPGMEDFKTYVRDVFGGIWAEAAEGANGGAEQFVNAFGILGDRLLEKAKEFGPKIVEGLLSAGQSAADYVTSNPTTVFKVGAIAAACLVAIAALPALVAAGLATTAALVVWGFVSGLIGSLGENIPKWWGSFTGWIDQKASEAGDAFTVLGTAIAVWFSGLWSEYVSGPVSRAWRSFVDSVQALPGRARSALSGLGPAIVGVASSAWSSFRDATVRRAMDLVGWVRGLPGMISQGIGHLGSLLYGKGQDVVRGLLRGIQGMGGWLRSQLISFARNMIPGPIAKALGIASPSKVMRDQIGRWIPAGIVDGIKGGAGAVARTMRDLVPVPSLPSLAPAGVGGAVGMAGAGDPFAGASTGGALVQIEHWHAAEYGTPQDNARELEWLAKGRG